jgi:hypothetical protein
MHAPGIGYDPSIKGKYSIFLDADLATFLSTTMNLRRFLHAEL